MDQEPDPDKTAAVDLTVERSMTADAFSRDPGERYPPVLATPYMIGEMERACAALMRPLLAPGQLSVGVKVEVTHLAPTPIGAGVKTTARFLCREGALFWFEVQAEDPGGTIGKGRHARAIVEESQILARASRRADAGVDAGAVRS